MRQVARQNNWVCAGRRAAEPAVDDGYAYVTYRDKRYLAEGTLSRDVETGGLGAFVILTPLIDA